MTRPRRYTLMPLWKSAQVVSCADGTIKVTPVWKGVLEYTEGEGGGPGLLMRLSAAQRLQDLIDAQLRRRK